MGTTVAKIREWLDIGRRIKATHMLVVHDSFDSDGGDYATFVQAGENPLDKAREITAVNGQHIIECYAFHLDLEAQLQEHRAHHYDMPPAQADSTTGTHAF